MQFKSMIYGALGCVLTLAGCTEKSNLEPEGQWELSAPTAINPAGGSAIVLDEAQSGAAVLFSWEAAASSANFGITYSVALDSANATDVNAPLLEVSAINGGKGLEAQVSHKAIDEAMSLAGFSAGSSVELKWVVKAKCLSRVAMDELDVTVKRFENEIIPTSLYVTGEASEGGAAVSNGLVLKRLNNANQAPSNKHEVYTYLKAGKPFMLYSANTLPAHKYGGADGVLVKNGAALTVEEDAVYKLTVDLDQNTYSLFKIEQMGAIGSPFATGWGADQFLEYKGMGVFSASLDFVNEGGFIFRANGTWENILKRVQGTTNQIVAESDAADQGVSFEDIPTAVKGLYILTLDLSGAGYTYSIERDPSTPDNPDPIPAPDNLYLFADGALVQTLQKDGAVFTSPEHVAMQTGVAYSLNDQQDGSGQAYSLANNIGVDPKGEAKVTGKAFMAAGAGTFAVEYDQAYTLSIDFEKATLNWQHFTLYLFHWDELNQKWDDRNEFAMTYVHPFKYTLTTALKANFDMKFISPWDVDMGAETAGALSGTAINKGGVNMRNITTDGTYTVTLEVDAAYAGGTYKFE